jgi:hypothetical protein
MATRNATNPLMQSSFLYQPLFYFTNQCLEQKHKRLDDDIAIKGNTTISWRE